MAYFRKLKLDPNFEDWLDAKILKLKAEGVIVSDEEQEDEEGNNVRGEHHEESQAGKISEEDTEFIWGEDPTAYNSSTVGDNAIDSYTSPGPEADGQPFSTHDRNIDNNNNSDSDFNQSDDSYNMAANSIKDKRHKSYKKAPQTESDPNSKFSRESSRDEEEPRHVSTEMAGDYYQFTWDSDEEAEIFDREEYQLGHEPKNGQSVGYNRQNSDSLGLPGRHVNVSRISQPPRTLGGLVLGIGRKDVEVAYTQIQSGGSAVSPDWDMEFREERLPDPRFSISDETDGHDSSTKYNRKTKKSSHDVPMLEIPPSTKQIKQQNQSLRLQAGSTRGVGGNVEECSENGHLPEATIEQITYGKDRILLPMDNMEMTMTSDDDLDDDGIDDDDFDVRSELAPDTANIVTVDQATLVQQWKSKSKRTQMLIVVGIVVAVVVVFVVVTVLVVHLLSGTT